MNLFVRSVAHFTLIPFGPAPLDFHIAAVDETLLGKTLSEAGRKMRKGTGRGAVNEPDDGQVSPLRRPGAGQCERRADTCD
jgi:hypothetical protein